MSDDLVKRLRDSTEWYHYDAELKMKCAGRIEELEAKLSKSEALLAKAVEALDEAIYLLDPEEEEIAKETGLHRIVTICAELKGEKDE